MTSIIAKFIKRFFSHYLPVQKGLAANAILAYRDALKLLLCYASDTLKKSLEDLCVEDLDESLVLDFLEHIENTGGCSTRTRNSSSWARARSVAVVLCGPKRSRP